MRTWKKYKDRWKGRFAGVMACVMMMGICAGTAPASAVRADESTEAARSEEAEQNAEAVRSEEAEQNAEAARNEEAEQNAEAARNEDAVQGGTEGESKTRYYEIGVSVGEHGAVIYTDGDRTVRYTHAGETDTPMVPEGGDARFTVQPEEGYYVKSLKADGKELEIGDTTAKADGTYEYTYANVTKTGVIEADFEKIPVTQAASIGEVGDCHMSFTVPQDADSALEDTQKHVTIYTLSRGAAVLLQAAEDRSILYEGSYQRIVRLDQSETLSGLTVRRDSGSFAGSVVKYELTQGISVIVDNEPPVVTLDDPGVLWVTGVEDTVYFFGSVSDEVTGVDRIAWFTEKKDMTAQEAEILGEAGQLVPMENGRFQFGLVNGGVPQSDTTYYLYAIDGVGNIAEAAKEVRIDQEGPEIVSFVSRDVTSLWDQMFTRKQQIAVTVTAKDAGSGVKSITLCVDGVPIANQPAENDMCTFTVELKKNAPNHITAAAEDKLGNWTPEPVEIGSGSSGDVQYDDGLPSAAVQPREGVYEKNGNYYWDEAVTLDITASDRESGLGSVEIKINGEKLTEDLEGKSLATDYTAGDQVTQDSFVIGTSQVQESPEGIYQVEITVTDAAGNTFPRSAAVYMDRTAPVIRNIAIEESQGTAQVSVETDDGAYGSGAAEILYYLEWQDGTTSEILSVPADDNGNAVITIDADFKGMVYAKAADHVGNEATEFDAVGNIITESPEEHERSSSVVLTPQETDRKDEAGNPLYGDSARVSLTVEDTFSGIQSVEWSVTASNDTQADQSGIVRVDGLGALSEDSWTVEASEETRVTRMGSEVTVSHNSNDIAVWVKLTDRAGNVSEETRIVSIDRTAPVITVSYEGAAGDRQYPDIYKESRTAVLQVRERNFDPDAFVLHISNSQGAVPALSGWTKTEDGADPENTYYTARLVFEQDGTYTFSADYKDRAGNAAAALEEQSFVVDRTAPEIQVAFDGADPMNGNYYSDARTATVTVKEENFDGGRIRITGSSRNQDTAVPFPETGEWSGGNGVYTAQLHFSRDGVYSLQIEAADQAGNVSETYSVEEFCIDATMPEVEISGVADRSANNGTVAPVVTFRDLNYDPDSVQIELKGANRGRVEAKGAYTQTEQGQQFAFEDFPREQAADDLYTLTATGVDLAGNETQRTIVFSVNRFGSVYAFDEGLSELDGTYVKEARDIALTETNVDELDRDSVQVVLSVNGTPRDLTEGVDYELEASGGTDRWCQYTYRFGKELFGEDARYSLKVYSEDAAGNVNENIDESKKAEISFGVDATPPVIVPTNLEDDGIFETAELLAEVSVADNLVLTDVQVTVDGKKVSWEESEGRYSFRIPESGERQNVKVVAQDAAGNQSIYEAANLLISTQKKTDPRIAVPVGIGAGIAGAAVIGGAAIVFRRRKVIWMKRR